MLPSSRRSANVGGVHALLHGTAGHHAQVTPLCRGALAAKEALRGGSWLHGQCCRGVALMSLQGCFWCADSSVPIVDSAAVWIWHPLTHNAVIVMGLLRPCVIRSEKDQGLTSSHASLSVAEDSYLQVIHKPDADEVSAACVHDIYERLVRTIMHPRWQT